MKTCLRFCKMFVLISAFGLLAACGSRLTPANLDKIHNDMTTAEVKSILGNPSEVKTSGFMGLTSSTYVYKKGNNEVTITFVNDKVMTKAGSFEQ